MVIREAIHLAEQYAKEYATSGPWHVVDAPHELSVVMETYFEEYPEAESLYNTDEKIYRTPNREMTYEEICNLDKEKKDG